MESILILGFSTGLLGSLHCLGMCGPLFFALPVGRFSKLKKGLVYLAYHSARILGYALIGAVLGFLGKGFFLLGYQKGFSVVAGLLIVIFSLFHLKADPYFLKGYKSRLGKLIGKFVREKTFISFPILGFLNAFLPCGLSYVAFTTSLATGNSFHAAAFLLFFGLGTSFIFFLFFAGLVNLKAKFAPNINKILPYYSLIIGLFLILRGTNFGTDLIQSSGMSEATKEIIICH